MRKSLLPLGLVLTLTGAAHAAFIPIPITPGSYNADVVVEKTATPALKVVTTASVDQGTPNGANTWMEAGFDPANPTYGLPAPGTVFTAISNANYSFQMAADYTAPNGILIDTVVTNGTLALTTPAAYTTLSFLGSGGNGGDVIGVTIRHLDGTVQAGNSFSCPDWFNGIINVAFIANIRCSSTVNFTTSLHTGSPGNPRIYFRDIAVVNTTSPITNVTLYYLSGPANSHNAILGISGATTPGGVVSPIAVTGWTYDFIVEKEAAKRGRIVTSTILDGTNVWATSQSMDNIDNTGNAWYEKGYNVNNPGDGGGAPIPDATVATTSGLPAPGSMITNSIGDHVYMLPSDYTVNNAVWVAIPPAVTNAVITLETPTAASVLSLLASAGSGPVNNVQIITTHADATTETNVVNVGNWFDGSPYVYGSKGRVEVGTAQLNNVRSAALNPRLYAVDYMLANTVSPVTSIEVINPNTTGGRIAIFALSGATGPVLPLWTTQPTSVKVSMAANVQFTAIATANVPITYQWQKGTAGVFVDLVNGGNVSGVTTTTLSVNNVTLADDANYRCVATDAAGSSTSSVAALVVLSPLADVTQPTDVVAVYQPLGGSFPAGEPPPNAINNNTTKYLNRGLNSGPMSVPVGFTVIPSAGRTIVTTLRFYTANDAEGRDPANSILEGSKNGGATWTLISSNALALPAGRNAAGLALDPVAQNVAQLRFANTNSYSSYRWYTTRVKGTDALMQIGEIEFLGVVDSADPSPFFVTQPIGQTVYQGSSLFMSVFASGTPAPTLRWLRGTNGIYVALNDGGAVSGSRTEYLSINPVAFTDAADYVCVAANASGSVTSTVAKVIVVSTLLDVTEPSDPILSLGDFSGGITGPAGAGANPINAIDNYSTVKYENIGSSPNGTAGFPPFEGPTGLQVTPAMGSTLVTGLRIYTADANVERDPADYQLDGSRDGGTSFIPITGGTLALPEARSDAGLGFDPTQQPMQEILFANHQAYTTYRLTINNVKGPVNDARSMQLGEIELLGVAAPGGSPTLTVTTGAGGSLTITSSAAGTLWSTTALNGAATVWSNEGAITGSVTITPVAGQPAKFYRVVVP